ncbi:hypothetical protein L208DRAFT_528558 [Tricholoma matsutake]|nr:hypothetical protein L208DRAFT_528558 [Tricholoma matsutake 945]
MFNDFLTTCQNFWSSSHIERKNTLHQTTWIKVWVLPTYLPGHPFVCLPVLPSTMSAHLIQRFGAVLDKSLKCIGCICKSGFIIMLFTFVTLASMGGSIEPHRYNPLDTRV